MKNKDKHYKLVKFLMRFTGSIPIDKKLIDFFEVSSTSGLRGCIRRAIKKYGLKVAIKTKRCKNNKLKFKHMLISL